MSEEAVEEEQSLPDQLLILTESSSLPSHNDDSTVGTSRKVIKLKAKEKATKLKSILQQKHPVKPRYFSCGVKVTDENARDCSKEMSPFEYPKDMDLFAHAVLTKAWRNNKRIKELEKKVHDRPNYWGRQKEQFLNRLYVDKPVMTAGKTMLNLNPNYYTVVAGRPISDRLNVNEYVNTVRESLRTKIVTGFREDDIILIDEETKLEQSIIDAIRENLQEYINTFEQFLIIDHRTAMTLLQQAESLSAAAYNKYVEHKVVAKKFAYLRSSLYNVEQKWKQCKTYQKFLYAVSPLTWKMEQEGFMAHDRRASIYVMRQKTDEALDIYASYRLSLVQRGISLQDIIKEFQMEIALEKPAALYFTEPGQLLDVFKFIEMQNLNSLLHTEGLAVPLENIKTGMKTSEKLFDAHIKRLREIIQRLEVDISWEEKSVIYLEKLAKNLVSNELRSLVTQEETLNLHVYVEDIYEAVIGRNDANLCLWEMMKAIEERYRHELLMMDKIPSNQVAKLEGSYYKEQMVVMKLAELAAKQQDELEKITVNLKKAYTPAIETHTRTLKYRSPPIKQPLREEEPPFCLNEEQEEFLEFFTDFCIHMDDPVAYMSRIKDLLPKSETPEEIQDEEASKIESEFVQPPTVLDDQCNTSCIETILK